MRLQRFRSLSILGVCPSGLPLPLSITVCWYFRKSKDVFSQRLSYKHEGHMRVYVRDVLQKYLRKVTFHKILAHKCQEGYIKSGIKCPRVNCPWIRAAFVNNAVSMWHAARAAHSQRVTETKINKKKRGRNSIAANYSLTTKFIRNLKFIKIYTSLF